MNVFDIVLLVLACGLVLLGMMKGLVRIVIGLAALLAAFFIAASYHQPLAQRLGGLELRVELLQLVAYGLIFLGVMLTGAILAYLARKLLKAAMLSWADRLGGAALGLVAAMLVAALVILPLVAYSPASQRLLAHSVLAPYVVLVADVANALVPDELSQRYRQGIEELRRRWSDPARGGAV
jgi:membrane protein required for colicin V production